MNERNAIKPQRLAGSADLTAQKNSSKSRETRPTFLFDILKDSHIQWFYGS